MSNRPLLYIIIVLWIVFCPELFSQNTSDSTRAIKDSSKNVDKTDSTKKKTSNFNEIVEFEAQDSMVLLFDQKVRFHVQ